MVLLPKGNLIYAELFEAKTATLLSSHCLKTWYALHAEFGAYYQALSSLT